MRCYWGGKCILLKARMCLIAPSSKSKGGGRVRTRNTLHVVGAAKSKIWHNAVEGRKKMKKKENIKIIKIL